MLSLMTGSLQMSEVERSAGVEPDRFDGENLATVRTTMFSPPTSTIPYHTPSHHHPSFAAVPLVTRTNTPYTTHSLMAPTSTMHTRYWQRATSKHTSYCDTLVPSRSTASLP